MNHDIIRMGGDDLKSDGIISPHDFISQTYFGVKYLPSISNDRNHS